MLNVKERRRFSKGHLVFFKGGGILDIANIFCQLKKARDGLCLFLVTSLKIKPYFRIYSITYLSIFIDRIFKYSYFIILKSLTDFEEESSDVINLNVKY